MTDLPATLEAVRAVDRIARATKTDLLNMLECIPQRYWPPRPTRQDVATLRACILRAEQNGEGPQ